MHRYQFFHSHREYRSASNRFEELPHAAEFFVPLFEQRAGSEREQIPQRAIEYRIQKRSGTLVVQVRSSFRFRNDFIDDAELAQIARRDLERFRGHFRFRRISPQNRRATLRGNYGIHRILEHVHAVPHGNRQRAARAAFARNRHNDGDGQPGHFAKIARDGLGLSALLGVDSRMRPWRIHKRKNRPSKFCGQMHDAQRFAIALGLSLPEIQRHALFGVSSLLLSDHRHRTAMMFREARDHRRIVSISAIAMQFVEILEQEAHVIHHVRALRMAREESSLPRAYVVVKLMLELRDFGAETFEILRRKFRPGKQAQPFHLASQFLEFMLPSVSFHKKRPASKSSKRPGVVDLLKSQISNSATHSPCPLWPSSVSSVLNSE